MLTEAVKARGCNAAEATVADGPRARRGGIVDAVAKARGCNATGAVVKSSRWLRPGSATKREKR